MDNQTLGIVISAIIGVIILLALFLPVKTINSIMEPFSNFLQAIYTKIASFFKKSKK